MLMSNIIFNKICQCVLNHDVATKNCNYNNDYRYELYSNCRKYNRDSK